MGCPRIPRACTRSAPPRTSWYRKAGDDGDAGSDGVGTDGRAAGAAATAATPTVLVSDFIIDGFDEGRLQRSDEIRGCGVVLSSPLFGLPTGYLSGLTVRPPMEVDY